MSRVVNFSELLPPDVVFELPGGQRVTFPGDPPLATILKLAAMFERLHGSSEVGIEELQAIDDALLELARMRNPDLETSPFGPRGAALVLTHVLSAYGVEAVEDGKGDDEGPPTRPARSTRSSGSRSSSKRSASRRTTGKR